MRLLNTTLYTCNYREWQCDAVLDHNTVIKATMQSRAMHLVTKKKYFLFFSNYSSDNTVINSAMFWSKMPIVAYLETHATNGLLLSEHSCSDKHHCKIILFPLKKMRTSILASIHLLQFILFHSWLGLVEVLYFRIGFYMDDSEPLQMICPEILFKWYSLLESR